MRVVQAIKKTDKPFVFIGSVTELNNPLVLVFGNRYALESPTIYEEVRELFPTGHIVFGTTSGEIIDEMVMEGTTIINAIEFERSEFLIKRKNVGDYDHDDCLLGESLIKEFPEENLRHLFVISEGSTVNGSALINGLEKNKKTSIGLSGGLCGDDDRFERTLVSYNENPKEGEIVAIGFYGKSLEVTSANYGGWTPFGPERIITKSQDNILYELDGKPALDLYKNYLGEKACELPKSALLYPLSVKTSDSAEPIVRTILNIDDKENAMILAGDVPEGAKVQLMMSSVDDIANGAYQAAQLAMERRNNEPEFALLVSCIGRKLVMDQRTEEEIEEVRSVVGENTFIGGFYSYGEMAPFTEKNACKLHNQTMTLTLFSE
ncbi:FIST C-terminal domain-containing protein [Maribacter sp. MMG018]|uniref:FIST signal transduction protein n=1 Tax=Maribacter sp. MMG018 TaxID=2822688 RepID=UPI001B373DDF|nr:FIST N-terminal domain-containing protein [Maribacter sp. MMG018]MBQ4914662.1 FIST C-terminal domain-containing protein [Maribacter sp. MMG018]